MSRTTALTVLQGAERATSFFALPLHGSVSVKVRIVFVFVLAILDPILTLLLLSQSQKKVLIQPTRPGARPQSRDDCDSISRTNEPVPRTRRGRPPSLAMTRKGNNQR